MRQRDDLHRGGGNLDALVGGCNPVENQCVEVVLHISSLLVIDDISQCELQPVVCDHQCHHGLDPGMLDQVFMSHPLPIFTGRMNI